MVYLGNEEIILSSVTNTPNKRKMLDSSLQRPPEARLKETLHTPYPFQQPHTLTIKPGLKLNIQKSKIIASGPITSRQIDGEKWKQWQIFLSSKITVDGDCSHEVKRCLLLGRKAMINLDSVLKSRDIILPMKVHTVSAVVFPTHWTWLRASSGRWWRTGKPGML